MTSSASIFNNVRYNEQQGTLKLTPESLQFKASLSKISWPVRCIQEFVLNPTTPSVDLKIQNKKGDVVQRLSFEMASLVEATQFLALVSEKTTKKTKSLSDPTPSDQSASSSFAEISSESYGSSGFLLEDTDDSFDEVSEDTPPLTNTSMRDEDFNSDQEATHTVPRLGDARRTSRVATPKVKRASFLQHNTEPNTHLALPTLKRQMSSSSGGSMHSKDEWQSLDNTLLVDAAKLKESCPVDSTETTAMMDDSLTTATSLNPTISKVLPQEPQPCLVIAHGSSTHTIPTTDISQHSAKRKSSIIDVDSLHLSSVSGCSRTGKDPMGASFSHRQSTRSKEDSLGVSSSYSSRRRTMLMVEDLPELSPKRIEEPSQSSLQDSRSSISSTKAVAAARRLSKRSSARLSKSEKHACSRTVSIPLEPAHKRPCDAKEKPDYAAVRPGAAQVYRVTSAENSSFPQMEYGETSVVHVKGPRGKRNSVKDGKTDVKTKDAAQVAMQVGIARPLVVVDQSPDPAMEESDLHPFKSEKEKSAAFSETSTGGEPALIEARIVEDSDEFDRRRSTVEASAVEIDFDDMRRKSVHFWVKVGCGFIFIIVIIVIIAVVASSNGSSTQASNSTLTTEEYYRLTREHVEGLVIDPVVLEDEESPHKQALNWLVATTSSRNVDLLDMTEEAEIHLDQKYLLALFYYSMTQERRWAYCRPPETGETNACVHHVIESFPIEGTYFNQQMSEPAFRWLSEAPECSWGGVRCSDGVHVSHLLLADYDLKGTLPVELARLQHLEVLDLQQNELYGTLPPEWGMSPMTARAASSTDSTPSGLKSVRLDQNLLRGSIPDEWCSLHPETLRTLILGNNAFTGSLPSCLNELSLLEDFSVINNGMTGTIPSSLGQLPNLQTLHLAGNSFFGTMPESVCRLKQEAALVETSTDCVNWAEHYVACPCCTKCCDGDDEASCQSGPALLSSKSEP